ncbi:hypothetical protein EBS43_12285 [bacterium]|nr:hypothetical protein [bacterium]
MRGLYQRWGVIPLIDEEVITPFLFRLVQITGLNSSVAMTLKVGDFCERHPLTDQPYIRYWKERARGEKELHLSLFDTKWMRLNSEQAREVSTLWKNLLDLTRRFRHQLDENKKELLFVYQSPSVKMMGKPHTLLNDSLTHMRWADRFVKKYKLCDDQGKPLRLTLARFRPSLVSRLVKKDVDLDVIQSILGHKSVIQTIRYIDSHDFAPEARAAVSKCLESIYSNHLEQKKENKPVATKEKIHEPVVFATAMALCKNVFSPPEQIKKGAGLAEGQACTNFNMCLRCSNVVIMKDHLPKLFALQESYLTALKNGLAQSTHKSAVIQTLSILDNLLDPKKSEFSEVELNWAKSLSEAEDPLVDTVAYRGVIS